MRGNTSTARRTARRMVHSVLEGDTGGLATALKSVAGEGDRTFLRAVLAELVRLSATVAREVADPGAVDPAFAVDLRDGGGDPVSIDELDPPARAMVRALLAELNGNPDDASFQLDLAVRPAGTGGSTVRQALTMTVSLLTWASEPR